MALIFYFFVNLPHLLIKIAILIISITISISLIKANKNQVDKVKGSNFLILAGIINLISGILLFILPPLRIHDFTLVDFQFYKLYNLFNWLVYAVASLLAFGVCFSLFSSKNKELFKNYLTAGGIIMIITSILQITDSTIFYTICIDDYYFNPTFSIEGNFWWYSHLALSNIILTLYGLAIAFFIIHGKLNQDKYFLYISLSIILIHMFGSVRNIITASI